MKGHKPLVVLCALGAAVSSMLITGCGAAGQAPATPTPWPTEVVVQQTSYTVQRGTVNDVFTLDARLSPVLWELVFFKVDGKLSVLNVSEGSIVAQGDVLAELDSKVLNDQLSQARLTLEQVQSQAQQTESSKKYALEKARLSLKTQELTLEKLRRTKEQGPSAQLAQAQAELERARVNLKRAQTAYDAVATRPDIAARPESSALQSATIDYNLAEAKYLQAQSQADIDIQYAQQEIQVQLARLAVQELEEKAQASGEGDVTKAEMQVQALERQIEERTLRSPFAGQVTAIGINLEGLTRGFAQRPKVGDSIPAYAPLVVVARLDPLEITADGSQKRVAELYIGQPVTVTHAAWARPFTATIASLPVAMTASGSQTVGSQAVHIALPASAPPMANNDPVRLYVQADSHPDVLFLPPMAVRRFAGRAFVVIQDGEKQRRVDIKLGLENDTQVEILSGLKEGDVVIGQ